MSKPGTRLIDLIDYIIETEKDDWEENGEPAAHVYSIAQAYRARAEALPELLLALKNLSIAVDAIRMGKRDGGSFGRLSMADDRAKKVLARLKT